jgi:hypothetical protein
MVRLAVGVLLCATAAGGCDYVFRLDRVPDSESFGSGSWQTVAAGDGTTAGSPPTSG